MGNSQRCQYQDLQVDKSKGQVHDDWTISPGVLHGTCVTVFSAVHPPSSRKRPYMEKALQFSKVYRHPGILKYMDGGIFQGEVLIVTENATPLLEHDIESMSPLEITAGLLSLVETLIFLHDKAGVSHNNICPSSIFITADGTWKLWSLEYSCSFGELTKDHIERIDQYCSEKFMPPDEKSRISPAYQHSRDSFAFGKFVADVVSSQINSEIPFFEEFLTLLNESSLKSDWSQRPRFSTLVEHNFFKHEFLQLRHNVTYILMLSDQKKEEFIRSLPEILRTYPEELVASTLVPSFLSLPILHIPSSVTHLMPALLIPKCNNQGGLFSPSNFTDLIVPHIVKLFTIYDTTIRQLLLTYFEYYAELIPCDVLAKDILPQLLLGIRDSDDKLVARTLRALAHLVPILGADKVVGTRRQNVFITTKPKDLTRGGKKKNIPKKAASSKINNEAALCTNAAFTATSPPPEHLPLVENIALDLPPERSAPDGGEVINDDVFSKSVTENSKLEEEQWSDWEEMMEDKPLPDIIGVLTVRTPDIEHVPLDESFGMKSDTNYLNSNEEVRSTRKESSSSLVSNTSSASSKSSAMQLKPKAVNSKNSPQAHGEEYNIVSIPVKKKSDMELDLFAELEPTLKMNTFNLESMLIEATNKCKIHELYPSVSDTMAEIADDIEGDGWNMDGDLNIVDPVNGPVLNNSAFPPAVTEASLD